MQQPESEPLTFKNFDTSYREDCLKLFDRNCPEYFAENERQDYVDFLDRTGGGLKNRIIGGLGRLASRSGNPAACFAARGDFAPRCYTVVHRGTAVTCLHYLQALGHDTG